MARQARTTENLKDRMADALLELLAEKPYSEISVSEITDRADVGRATYYRHFASKKDVLLYKFDVIFAQAEHHEALRRPYQRADQAAIKEHLITQFKSLFAYKDVLQLIYSRDLDYVLFVYMYKETIARLSDKTLVSRYRTALHAATTFAITDQWITSGFEQTPEEMVDLIMYQLRPGPHPPERDSEIPWKAKHWHGFGEEASAVADGEMPVTETAYCTQPDAVGDATRNTVGEMSCN